jgi:hypothetical protein
MFEAETMVDDEICSWITKGASKKMQVTEAR